MFINNISKLKVKRLGRGESSGLGKTSGRGTKGQKSRAGSKRFFNFENTHFKLLKKIPKRGFFIKKNYTISLNLIKINKIPLTLITSSLLNKTIFLKKKLIKFFSNHLLFKKIIFYKIFLPKLIFFFNLNFYYIYND